MLAFVAQPVAFVFAQEAPVEETSSTTTEGAGEESTPVDSGESEGSVEDVESGEEDPPPSLLDSGEAIDPPTISNPNLFTSKSQLPNVNESGALVHSMTLDIPPGRNGLTPDVTLTYNSQQLEDGVVGYGWSLSLPYIERLNRTGSERLYVDNYFTSSLGGEIVMGSTTNEYAHRFEDGRFIKYTFANNSWVAYDKKGTKYTFGAASSTQLYATTSPSNVYRWMLQEVRDANDNYITYDYVRDSNGNQIYPSRITYTGNGVSDGIFTIDFATSTRSDPVTSYKSGFIVRTTNRITQITASVDGSWVRKYALSYTTGQNGARSLLSGVQETGRDEALNELTLPATTFSYSSTTPAYTSNTNLKTWNASRVIGDVDGNGLPDLTVFNLDLPGPGLQALVTTNAYPYFPATEVTPPTYWSDNGLCYTFSWCDAKYRFLERGARYIDVSGDGKPDAIRSQNISSGSKSRGFWRTIGNGTSWIEESIATSSIPMFGYEDGGSTYSGGIFGNVNGDSLVDYVLSLPAIGSNQDANGTYLHDGTRAPEWTLAASTFSPVAQMPTSGDSQIANELVDINGDGLDDWMNASSSVAFCLNTGSAWDCSNAAWNIATTTRNTNGWDRGIRFIDINGDGLVDYVRSYSVSSFSSNTVPAIEVGSYNYVYLNTGFGWATSTLQVPGTITSAAHVSSEWTGRIIYSELADWNGDGILDGNALTSTSTKPDILQEITYPTGGSSDMQYAFSAQSGLNPDLAFPFLTITSIANHDNLGSHGTTTYAYEGGKIYTGEDTRDRRFAGFGRITKSDSLGFTQTYYHQGDTASTTIGELTDSLALLAKPYREDVLSLASATLKSSFYRWDVDAFSVTSTSTPVTNTHSVDLEKSSSQYVHITDGSQTGLDVTNALTLAGWYKFESIPSSAAHVLINKGRGDDSQRSYKIVVYDTTQVNLDLRLSGNGSGSENETVTWTPSADVWYHVAATYDGSTVKFYVNGAQQGTDQSTSVSSLYNSNRPFKIGAAEDSGGGPEDAFDGLVDDVRIWSRVLSAGEIEELYESASTFSDGLKGVWQFDNAYTDASGNSNTLTAVNSPVFSTTVAYSGTATSTSENRWFAHIGKEMVQIWDGGATHKDTAVEYTYATSTGNLTEKIERGEVSGSSNGTYSDTGSDTRFTSFTYSTTTGINLSLPTRKLVKNNASTTVADIKFYYDEQSFGSTTKGNLTKEETWIGGTTYASSTKTYNAYGLVATSTDPRGNATRYQYDAFNLYPATTTSALGHVTTATYDYAKGVAKRVTDVNGLVRETVFDPVGRMSEEKQPNIDSPSSLVTSKLYTYTDTFPMSVRIRSYLTSGTTTDHYAYRDGLGRTLQERSQAGGDTTYTVKDYVYNDAGLVFKESLPYFASSTAKTAATSTAALFTTYLYDGLQRPTSISSAVGTTTYVYAGWQTQITDLNGNPKEFNNDAYGNLNSVIEHDESVIATTTYAYDALNNLTNITDASSNVRSFTYDGLSRRLTAQDLHDAGDGTFGTWSYAYDPAGNLASTTDPKGQVTEYAYDAVNRILSENYTGGAGTEISYSYDSCTYGIGKLCTASSTDAVTSTTYNALGLAAAEGRRIGNTQYASTTYAYDRQGNPSTITYPDGREVVYGYDNGGRMSNITTRQSGGSFSGVLSRIEYAPQGQVSLRTYANGISTPFTYNANELYRLSRIGGTGGIQDITYTYDDNGNILSIADAGTTAAARTVLYEYDTLNRLVSASTTAATSTPFRQVYRYDLLGNLLYKSLGNSASAPNTHSIDLELGSSQFASVADASQTGLDFSDALSFSSWVQFESFPAAERPIMVKRVGAGSQRSYTWSLSGTHDVISLVTYTNGSSIGCNVSVAWSPSLATWYHIAVTKTGTTVKFYVNGSQQGSNQTCSSATVFDGTAPFELGGFAVSPDYFDGLIDDARVWSRELSGSEVTSLYSSPSSFANGANLQASWQLNNTYTDASGNGNTLTGQNSPVFSMTVPYVSAGGEVESNNYTYAETNYANPHAPTGYFNGVATTTFAYDQNGNLTGASGATTSNYTWDYRNRMIEAWTQGATTTYGYDHTTNRVRQTTPTATTHYINQYFSKTGATTTDYIWHYDTMVAYIEGNGSATTTHYAHPDHLRSTNVVTSQAGVVMQTLDYYPYGELRINSGSNTSDRQFIGQRYDSLSNLNYLNARYYSGGRGQFISQDPVFLGDPKQQDLLNPQNLNSYSYSMNNPINVSDPSGRLGKQSISGAQAGILSQMTQTLRNILSILQRPDAAIIGLSNTVSGAVQHPIQTAQSISQSAGQAINTFRGASDYQQGVMIGQGLVTGAGFLVGPKGLKGGQVLEGLPDSTLVCRGGACTPKEFIEGTGVNQGSNGTLSGVSVFVGVNGESKAELLSKLPPRFEGRGGFTTLGEIRATPGTLYNLNPNTLHADMAGLNADAFTNLFNGLINN